MKDIQYIKFTGQLDVTGIYNYNGAEKKKGNNNHKGAKRDRSGRDYTSSRCIRHEMFKDIQPRQPASNEFSKFFIDLAASEVGLIRGYLSPEDGFKRNSPLYISDAYTDDQYLFEIKYSNTEENELEKKSAIVYDQGISSKPKESQKTNKKGEASSDTSIFSQDNAPNRKQNLFGAINIKELQFLSLDDLDPSFRMVSQKSEKEFVEKLKQYFSVFNINDPIEIKEYKDTAAVLDVTRRGILLSQNHIRHLIKMVVSRIKSIDGLKAGASLKTDAESLKISFGAGDKDFTKTYSDFLTEITTITFKEFYRLS